MGLALAGGGTNWSLAQGLGGGKSDAFQAGVYGATRSGPAYLAAAFAFTNHWMSTDRFALPAIISPRTSTRRATADGSKAAIASRHVTAGITPYAAIQAQSFRTPGYSETDVNGGGFALGYTGRTATDTRSELGARFDRVLALYPNAVLALRARLAWAHDWVSDPTLAAVFQTLPGASFIVNGATPAKNSALASAGAELRLANGISLLAKFDGEFASTRRPTPAQGRCATGGEATVHSCPGRSAARSEARDRTRVPGAAQREAKRNGACRPGTVTGTGFWTVPAQRCTAPQELRAAPRPGHAVCLQGKLVG